MWIFLSCTHGFISIIFYILSFLNPLPMNSFPLLYIFIGVRGYLHNHVCSTRFYIISVCMSLYCTISNHPVSRSIIVKSYSMSASWWPFLLIIYRPIWSHHSLYCGMASASLGCSFPYLGFCFLFFWKVLNPLCEYVYCTLS